MLYIYIYVYTAHDQHNSLYIVYLKSCLVGHFILTTCMIQINLILMSIVGDRGPYKMLNADLFN